LIQASFDKKAYLESQRLEMEQELVSMKENLVILAQKQAGKQA
jgi:hypothetical protein